MGESTVFPFRIEFSWIKFVDAGLTERALSTATGVALARVNQRDLRSGHLIELITQQMIFGAFLEIKRLIGTLGELHKPLLPVRNGTEV